MQGIAVVYGIYSRYENSSKVFTLELGLHSVCTTAE